MKKVLSIVLILAALFGLGAGFVDLQDVLSCKSFWEAKGEESDANLTMLFDGLTTLQDNKQAYTDGLVTVAEGEEQLAAGKKAYEEGLAQYNAGVEEYNQGLADYEQGMADLGKGRNTLLSAKEKLSVYTDKQKSDAKTAMGDPTAKGAATAVNSVANGSTDATTVSTAAVATVAAGSVATSLPGTTPQDVIDAAAVAKAYQLSGGTTTAPTSQQQTMAGALKDVGDASTAVKAWQDAGSPAGSTPPTAALTAASKVKGAADAYSALLLTNGMNEYDNGLADYYIAKGTLAWAEKKLAAAQEQLDAAEKQLADGKKSVEDGEKALEEGKASLKTYEDGVAQVKAGLAQVLATKAEAGLTSIADRLGAGFKYTDGDELLIDKGFEAVAAAREYSAESSAIISKELTSRAIGAILVMIAAVLAAVAGVFGFIKSGKIAGLLAIVGVAAAVIGAALSYLAGNTMSVLAGSAASPLMLIAAACVAVIGLAYGIVAMASKAPAAKAAE